MSNNGNNDGINQRMGKVERNEFVYFNGMYLSFGILAGMSMNDNNNGGGGGGYQKAAYIPPHLRGRAYGNEGGNQSAGGWDKPAPRPG